MTVIDDYLADVPKPERGALERVRRIVHQTVPEAEEVISYRIPGFKYKGQYLCGFSAFKDHLSFFPTGIPGEMFPKLKSFKTSRGTIQFTLDNPIPEAIIKELLTSRVAAIDG